MGNSPIKISKFSLVKKYLNIPFKKYEWLNNLFNELPPMFLFILSLLSKIFCCQLVVEDEYSFLCKVVEAFQETEIVGEENELSKLYEAMKNEEKLNPFTINGVKEFFDKILKTSERNSKKVIRRFTDKIKGSSMINEHNVIETLVSFLSKGQRDKSTVTKNEVLKFFCASKGDELQEFYIPIIKPIELDRPYSEEIGIEIAKQLEEKWGDLNLIRLPKILIVDRIFPNPQKPEYMHPFQDEIEIGNKNYSAKKTMIRFVRRVSGNLFFDGNKAEYYLGKGCEIEMNIDPAYWCIYGESFIFYMMIE